MPGPRAAAPPHPLAWPGDRGGHLWAKDREVVLDDGTRVRYAVRGPGDAPVVVGAAGFLCPDNFWRDLAPPLSIDHRVVILNYRGTGASTEAGGGATPPAASAYTIPHLAEDVAAVLDAEGARRATVLGHSMGVQVALALWRARPELVGALVLVAGTYASPFRTMYGRATAAHLFPLLSMFGAAAPREVTRRLLRAIELPLAMPVGRVLRAVGATTPLAGMTTYRAHMTRMDPRTAIWTARAMHGFDPTPWLHRIDVPTSVLVGNADGWCPVSVGEALVAAVPDAQLEVVDGASHTLPLEFPEVVLPHVRRLAATTRTTGTA